MTPTTYEQFLAHLRATGDKITVRISRREVPFSQLRAIDQERYAAQWWESRQRLVKVGA